MSLYAKSLFGGIVVICTACVLAVNGKDPGSERFTFASIDYPGAVSTAIWGVNNRGDVVGTYDAPANFYHGFTYRNGKFTTVDGPGAAFTQIRSINDAGDIAGTFINFHDATTGAPGGGFQGLYQKHGGSLTTMSIPGHLNTIFNRIKSGGLIYGCYHDDGVDDSPQDSMHGVVVRLDRWPAVDAMASGTTMNSGGDAEARQFGGMWYDHTLNRHRAYAVNRNHRVDFDVPGSNLTTVWDMNSEGESVGVWGDKQGHPNSELVDEGLYHGFLRSRSGVFTSMNYPGSIDTKAQGINDEGLIVGSYTDAGGKIHGFLAVRGDFRSVRDQREGGLEIPFSLAPAAWTVTAKPPQQLRSPVLLVASMPVIPRDRPLEKAAQVPACHRIPARREQ